MQDDLKSEIKNLNKKLAHGQKLLVDVKDSIERGDSSPRNSPRTIASPRRVGASPTNMANGRMSPRASISRKIGFVQGTKPKSRRGTTMGLADSTRNIGGGLPRAGERGGPPNSPKPKARGGGVALSAGIGGSTTPASTQEAMEKISNFSYNHGENFDGGGGEGGDETAAAMVGGEGGDKGEDKGGDKDDEVYAQGMSKYLVQSPKAKNGVNGHPVLKKQSSSSSINETAGSNSVNVNSPRHRSSR